MLLSAHQVRLNACTGGMLNHNRGAGDLAEEALKAVDPDEPDNARPNFETLRRHVNKYRVSIRPKELKTDDFDFEVFYCSYLYITGILFGCKFHIIVNLKK